MCILYLATAGVLMRVRWERAQVNYIYQYEWAAGSQGDGFLETFTPVPLRVKVSAQLRFTRTMTSVCVFNMEVCMFIIKQSTITVVEGTNGA